jgi:tetratricopeptide (TPR) repeat protein
VQTGGWTANDGKYSSEEAGTGWFPSIKVRLFPNNNRIRFENPVHELVEPSLNRVRMQANKCGIPVHHYGKLLRKKIISKGEEYYVLGKKKIEDLGNNIDALCELAIQASEIGKYDEAVELWQKVIGLKPDFSKAFFNMGHAYLELGRYSEALAASQRAADLNPHMKEAVYNYALCELFAGDVKKAVTVFEDLLQELPDYPSAKVMLAVAYCCDSKKEKGIELLEKLQRMNFGFANVLFNFAKKLISAGRLEYAISLLDAAVESNNISQNIITLRNRCYKMRACSC